MNMESVCRQVITAIKRSYILWVWIFSIASIPLAHSQTPIVPQVMKSIEDRFRKSKLHDRYLHPTANFKPEDNGFIAHPKNARVMTLMNGEDLIQALKDGEIKNQHQVGKSGGGGYNPKLRMKIEEGISGLNLKKIVSEKKTLNQVLPKYGMIEFHDFASDTVIQELWGEELKRAEDLDSYGEISVYFKENVKNRTSFIPADSGNLAYKREIGEWVQTLRQEKIIIDGLQMDHGSFFEAQIWGKLKLSDIDYVVVPRELYFDDSASVKDIERALKAAGIPIYRPKKSLTVEEEIMERLRVRFRNKETRLLPQARKVKCSKVLRAL